MEKLGNGWLWSLLGAAVYLILVACLSLSLPLVEVGCTEQLLLFCYFYLASVLVLSTFLLDKWCNWLLVALSFQWLPLICTHLLWRWYLPTFSACLGCNQWQSLLAHLVAPLEHTCTSPSLDELSLRLDWQLACVDPIHSFPSCSLTSCLPPLVHAAVWSVLPWHRVARMRLHTQHLVFSSQRAADEVEVRWRKTRSIWKQPCGLPLRTLQLYLTLVELPSPVNIQQRDSCRLDHVGLPPRAQLPLTKDFFFFLVGSFLNATIFSGTRLGFSLILCTSMDTSGSVVSTRAEEPSFHVRYR